VNRAPGQLLVCQYYSNASLIINPGDSTGMGGGVLWWGRHAVGQTTWIRLFCIQSNEWTSEYNYSKDYNLIWQLKFKCNYLSGTLSDIELIFNLNSIKIFNDLLVQARRVVRPWYLFDCKPTAVIKAFLRWVFCKIMTSIITNNFAVITDTHQDSRELLCRLCNVCNSA